jgi:hypothetical protein
MAIGVAAINRFITPKPSAPAAAETEGDVVGEEQALADRQQPQVAVHARHRLRFIAPV